VNIKKIKQKKAYIGILLGIIYAVLILVGPIGYGIDVHESYIYADSWGWGGEPVGWFISSRWLSILGLRIYIGAFLTALILSYGLYALVNKLLAERYSNLFILAISFLLFFTHPIIFGSTNVLRQGVSQGFYYLMILYFINKKSFQFILYFILAFLSHNSIIIMSLPFIVEFYNIGEKIKKIFYMVYILCVMIFVGEIAKLKSVIDTNTNYFPYLTFLFAIVNIVAFMIFRNYKLKNFNKYELSVYNLLIYNLFLVLIFYGSQSIIQRLSNIIIIPLLLFLFINIPLKKYIKLFILILFIILWVIITLNSEALKTWRIL
jgi:hypothetical protein